MNEKTLRKRQEKSMKKARVCTKKSTCMHEKNYLHWYKNCDTLLLTTTGKITSNVVV